jgi:glycosyltransferase involved in cell wall biosynthesis
MFGPGAGGVGAVFSRAAQELRARGHSVREVVVDGQDGPEALAGLRAAWRARAAVRTAGVVHLEIGSNDRAVFWAGLAACLLRRDCVVIAHDVPLLALQPGASLIRRSSRVRMILAHRIVAPLIDPVVRSTMTRRVSVWLVLGDAAVGSWRTRVRGQVRRLHLGWDLGAPRAAAPSASDHVLFAGFLGPSKGVDDLVEAWGRAARAGDPPLLVAGATDMSEWLEGVRRRADALDHPPHWLGGVDEAQFEDLFADAALVVMPYRSSSSASGILVRALAAGRPILATAVPAIHGLVHDGVEGRVVAPGDVGALAAALRELLDDPAARDRMGAAAAERARSELSWERHADDLEAAYAAARSSAARRSA